MLSKKDKEWIEGIVKKVVVESLTVDWTVERVRDEKTGQPLAVPEKITEKVFIPSAFLQMLPYHEGALRGMQEDVSRNNNKINDLNDKLAIVGNILLQTENSLKCLAALSDHIKGMELESGTNKYIEESINGKSDS